LGGENATRKAGVILVTRDCIIFSQVFVHLAFTSPYKSPAAFNSLLYLRRESSEPSLSRNYINCNFSAFCGVLINSSETETLGTVVLMKVLLDNKRGICFLLHFHLNTVHYFTWQVYTHCASLKGDHSNLI